MPRSRARTASSTTLIAPYCLDSDTEAVAPAMASHLVSQEYAQGIIASFRASAAPGAIRSQSLERSAVDALLAQPGVAGLRIYYGKYADGSDTFVLYATDKDGRDLPQTVANGTRPCPPYCPDSEAGEQ